MLRNLLIDVDRQHAPRRVLHRQAVLARQRHRAPGAAGDARLRDAAARAHEPGAAAAAARAGGALLAAALPAGASDALGHRAARPLHAAAFRLGRILPTCSRRPPAAGYALKREWFAPHFEFRFPRLGDFAAKGVEVELRQALEPWHVLGEEGAAGGTVRYVDSSVERMQVKVSGPDRHPPRAHLQRPARAAAADRQRGRIRRRRALPRLAAAVSLHPTIGVACAADLRPRRHLDEPVAGRLPAITSRIPAGATTTPSRSMPTRPKPPAGAILPHRPHPGKDGACGRTAQPQFPVHFGLAPANRIMHPDAQPNSRSDTTCLAS